MYLEKENQILSARVKPLKIDGSEKWNKRLCLELQSSYVLHEVQKKIAKIGQARQCNVDVHRKRFLKHSHNNL